MTLSISPIGTAPARPPPAGTAPRPHAQLLAAIDGAALLGAALAAYFLVVSAACGAQCTDATKDVLATVGLVAATAGFLRCARRATRGNMLLILTPAVGFMLCCALFFGFGSLSTTLMDDKTRSFVAVGWYMVTGEEQIRASALTFTGAGLLFMAMGFTSRLSFKGLSGRRRVLHLRTTALVFVLSGLLLKYGVLIPTAWGYVDRTVPGVLTTMAPLPDLGFLLMTMAITRGDRRLRVLFLLLWVPHLALTTLELSKTAIVLAILMPAIGFALGGRKLYWLLPWIASAVLSYLISQNAFLHARSAVLEFSGIENHAPIEKRIVFLAEGVGHILNGRQIEIDSGSLPPQLWWVRLNYSGPQVRAMQMYDNGQSMGWLVSPLAYVVPRFLWPSKPELVNPGQVFNRTVSGNAETLGRVAITVFGDGYMLAGWPGAILIALATGLIFGVITRRSADQLLRNDLLYLPLIVLGFKLGTLDVLGFFQTSILGGLSIYIGLSLVFAALSMVLNVRR